MERHAQKPVNLNTNPEIFMCSNGLLTFRHVSVTTVLCSWISSIAGFYLNPHCITQYWGQQVEQDHLGHYRVVETRRSQGLKRIRPLVTTPIPCWLYTVSCTSHKVKLKNLHSSKMERCSLLPTTNGTLHFFPLLPTEEKRMEGHVSPRLTSVYSPKCVIGYTCCSVGNHMTHAA